MRLEGHTVLFVAIDGSPAGLLSVFDPIRESSYEAMQKLHDQHIDIVMLTGDHITSAVVIAKKLGIDEVEAEVLPDDKQTIIKEMQMQGRRVAMAGDGINDAPALMQADVGIAMSSGSNVALESAGLTLMQADLRGIVKARTLSAATLRNIRQNLFFAFFYNILAIPLAAGVFYPAFGFTLNPLIASAAMTASSLCVIANALRLKTTRL
jgi:Cu+-exporting ATPase